MRPDLMITAAASPYRRDPAQLGHQHVPAHQPAKRLEDGPRTLDGPASSSAGRAVGRDVAMALSDGQGIGGVIVPGRVGALEEILVRGAALEGTLVRGAALEEILVHRVNGTAEVSG